ncbi:hypothetical protein HMI56_007072 [Coelomomyces lativittatus]|nr:hypothetical protein HMI56_007072 [Coelomomyces lativittatus]
MSDAWLFLFSVIVSAVLLFAMVFFIIMFSDLECDYINPIDLCQKLNQFILPEYAAHAVLTLVFLLHFSWFALMLNLPLAGYHLRKYVLRREGRFGGDGKSNLSFSLNGLWVNGRVSFSSSRSIYVCYGFIY